MNRSKRAKRLGVRPVLWRFEMGGEGKAAQQRTHSKTLRAILRPSGSCPNARIHFIEAFHETINWEIGANQSRLMFDFTTQSAYYLASCLCGVAAAG